MTQRVMLFTVRRYECKLPLFKRANVFLRFKNKKFPSYIFFISLDTITSRTIHELKKKEIMLNQC
jgi:hypothetical protein